MSLESEGTENLKLSQVEDISKLSNLSSKNTEVATNETSDCSNSSLERSWVPAMVQIGMKFNVRQTWTKIANIPAKQEIIGCRQPNSNKWIDFADCSRNIVVFKPRRALLSPTF